MMIWTQWADLQIPPGLSAAPTNGISPSEEDLEFITFYVPMYMGGDLALEPIRRMPKLQVVQVPNAGFDDVIPLVPAHVTLCNARGVHDASTAELAIGLTIASRRGFAKFMQDQIQGKWNHERHASLADSRVGIVGMGSIGTLIASQLEHFSVEVIGFSRSGKNGAISMAKFDELLPSLDVVILILPLTPETRHLMNAQRLERMKQGATIVNVARGAVIDVDALVKVLDEGRISAGLDVTDPEPLPPDHPLWRCPNCIITPHVGGDTTAFEPRARKLVEEQLKRFSQGLPLLNVVAGPRQR